ncbi:hypothetical protein [Nocardioides houyundeii]|uniref:hypothetical protein n=1 Tax=Nocardioides houyundeii TaxID=2045452 RepID=UPI0013155FD3|nr:hypothetical protein [Nocardioides houyundeii]
MTPEECRDCGALVNPHNSNRHRAWHDHQTRQTRKILHDGQALQDRIDDLERRSQ